MLSHMSLTSRAGAGAPEQHSAGATFIGELSTLFTRIGDILRSPKVLETGAAFFDALQEATGAELTIGSRPAELPPETEGS